MNKITKKKYSSYNSDIIRVLAEKYGTVPQYVRQCVRGDSKSLRADEIRKEYQEKEASLRTLLKK